MHVRLATVRQILTPAGGRPFGRPALAGPSKYLLTNLAFCGGCGGPLRARSRKDAAGRYGCSWYHERGRTVRTNNADVPMVDADDMLLEALLDDVLDAAIVRDAVDEAVSRIVGKAGYGQDPGLRLARQIAKVEQECERLVSAIAAGGMLDSLLTALREREVKLEGLKAELAVMRAQRRPQAADVATIRADVLRLVGSWRRVLLRPAGLRDAARRMPTTRGRCDVDAGRARHDRADDKSEGMADARRRHTRRSV